MSKIKKALEDRDISWLRFNERVLEEAQDKNNPLYERLHFISIFCNNLDKFFMVRVGALIKTSDNLKTVYKFTKELLDTKDYAYNDIMQQLKSYSINQITIENITNMEHEYLHEFFKKQLSTILCPVIIDKDKKFPSFNNKQIMVAVSFESEDNKKAGIIEIKSTFPQIIIVPNTNSNVLSYILMEDLIIMFIEEIFIKDKVIDKAIIRITRNADINEEDVLFDDDIDSTESVSQLIQIRSKLAPIRMECIGSLENKAINNVRKVLNLDKDQVFHQIAPLDMTFVQELKEKIPMDKYSALYYPPLAPRKSLQINEKESMIDQVKKKDILLLYPFEDISQFIRLINEAGADKRVQYIKITLYRVAENSKIIESLINASQNGKEVICVVELRAKFDENKNIGWAKKLEYGGCKVVYGLPEFKVHSKIMLITLINNNHVEYITQIGTGNYNETTAKVYCDLTLITAHQEIGSEGNTIFEKLQERKFIENTKHLLVAPLCFEYKIIDLIENEIEKAKEGKKASIILKLNALTDKNLIKKLIQASQIGVKVQLIIRDICCLNGGVEEITENINVRSIVGRFLEHSRIYKFGQGNDSKIYISSADFMKKNTAHRVEIAVPIYDADCKKKVSHLLNMMLKDNVKARIQMSNGQYELTQIENADKQIDYQVEMFNEE